MFGPIVKPQDRMVEIRALKQKMEEYDLAKKLLMGDEQCWDAGGEFSILKDQTCGFKAWATPSILVPLVETATMFPDDGFAEKAAAFTRHGTFRYVEGEWKVQGLIETVRKQG